MLRQPFEKTDKINHGNVPLLADLRDEEWELYQAGRGFLFATLYNRLLGQPIPREATAKVAWMKALSALRIGVPVYERDAAYRRRLGRAQDAGGGWDDGW